MDKGMKCIHVALVTLSESPSPPLGDGNIGRLLFAGHE